jgi:NitT/TauT family transport system substrate-binding protein
MLALVGCTGGAITPSPEVNRLTVGLGYIASVQFAPFYRAQQQGYYRDEGLEITFQNEIDSNLITLVGQGAVDIGLADGTSVIPAVGQGIPIKYVGTVYAKFPNVVMTPAASGITDAGGLAGHTLGTPGRYGSSWIMLQALLASAGLTVTDVDVQLYPDFGQATGLQQGQVDAATGFRNNEPVMLGRQGFDTNVLTIDEITPLPGPGIIVGVTTMTTKHEALMRFITATSHAMRDIQLDPAVGLEDAIAIVPELASDRDGQLAVLRATVEMWSTCCEEHGIMWVDRAAWIESLDFMRGLPDSNIPADLKADDLMTQEFME